jgi:VanZ family protein
LTTLPGRLFIYRACAGVAGLGLLVLFLGPFQHLEAALRVSDEQAHVAAFFAITLGLFLAFPDRRRTDLGLMALAIGVLIEGAQAFTGRSASLGDLGADAIGIGLAVAPALVERLRHPARRRSNARAAGARDAGVRDAGVWEAGVREAGVREAGVRRAVSPGRTPHPGPADDTAANGSGPTPAPAWAPLP